MLGSNIATYEELSTLLSEIEACLISRPLCTLSSDPHSSTYLSPGHFLIGNPLVQLPTADLTKVNPIDYPVGKHYSNNYKYFGNGGLPTTCTNFNNVNAGIR